jgi:hypothetical protein
MNIFLVRIGLSLITDMMVIIIGYKFTSVLYICGKNHPSYYVKNMTCSLHLTEFKKGVHLMKFYNFRHWKHLAGSAYSIIIILQYTPQSDGNVQRTHSSEPLLKDNIIIIITDYSLIKYIIIHYYCRLGFISRADRPRTHTRIILLLFPYDCLRVYYNI